MGRMSSRENSPPPHLVQLTYVSAAKGVWTDAVLADILEVSRRNNARDNITGLLVYKSGNIIQILEGEEAAVRRMYSVIESDERHHLVTLLFVWPIETRSFPDWTMSFRKIEPEANHGPDGSSDFLQPGFDFKHIGSERAQRMLKTFVANVR